MTKRVVAHVEVGQPDASVPFEEWRAKEDERMWREIVAQFIADLERQAGAVEH